MEGTIKKLFKGLSLKEIEEIVFGVIVTGKQRNAQPVLVKNNNTVKRKK